MTKIMRVFLAAGVLALAGCAAPQLVNDGPIPESRILGRNFQEETKAFGLVLYAQRLFRFARNNIDDVKELSDEVLANRLTHIIEQGDALGIKTERSYAYLASLYLGASPKILEDARLRPILTSTHRNADARLDELYKAILKWDDTDAALKPDPNYWQAIDSRRADPDRIPRKDLNYTLVYRTNTTHGVKDAVLFLGREDRVLWVGDIEPNGCFQTAQVGLPLPQFATVAWKTVSDGAAHYQVLPLRANAMGASGKVGERILFTFGRETADISTEKPCH